MLSDKTLKEQFNEGLELLDTENKTLKPTYDEKEKNKLKKALEIFHGIYNYKKYTPALYYIACIEMRLAHEGAALELYERVINYDPLYIQAYNNIGCVYKLQQRFEQARQMWDKCLELTKDPKFKEEKKMPDQTIKELKSDFYSNIGSLYVSNGTAKKAIEFFNKALNCNEHNTARWNRALANLELGNWQQGFADYHHGDRYAVRKSKNYHQNKTTPDWDGTKGKNIVVFGEQGLGDEIMFGSIIPDVAKDCFVILDMHPRLAPIFRRSFPKIPCYATRKDKEFTWPSCYPVIDACQPIGNLGKFYRKKDSDFPKKPYLIANPEYRKKIKEKLAFLKDKPKIGISWKGGILNTNSAGRHLELEKWLDIFKLDAEFISLQYHEDAQIEIDRFFEKHEIEIHHWPKTLQAFDYDWTAALVSELDFLISVPQSVVHLAGALGKEVIQMSPYRSMWQNGRHNQDPPWYGTVQNIWQSKPDDWEPVLKKTKTKAQKMLEQIKKDKEKKAAAEKEATNANI